MPFGHLPGVLPPHVMHEAASLLYEILGGLHAVTAGRSGVLFALAASPQLADRLAAFGASVEDDEDDGSGEPIEHLSPALLTALLEPAPRQGHRVPEWAPPDPTLHAPLEPPGPDLGRHWPDLVRRRVPAPRTR